jgi:hypothetical protein
MNRGCLAAFAPWTPAEVATLRTAYASGGIEAARAALPGRSTLSLYKKARRLGVRRKRSAWTERDYARLRALWSPETTLEALAEALRSTPKTVYWIARHRLNLPVVPEGWEYLTHAARRTGYCTSQLAVILRAAGVKLHRVLSRPTAPRGKRAAHHNRFRVVWSADVDEAVADWTQRESALSVHQRLGISDTALRVRLRLAGIKKPTGKQKASWRLTPEDLERALSVRMVRTRERGRYSGARYEVPVKKGRAA